MTDKQNPPALCADQAEEKAEQKREKAMKKLADLGQEWDRAAALAEADAHTEKNTGTG